MRLRIQRFLHSPFILESGIVGFSTLSIDLGNRVSPGIGLDAVLEARRLSKLVQTLKMLMPELPGE
jgi:hypothetical protein